MATLMVPVMDLLWVHKWKLHLSADVMSRLMDTLMAFLWVHNWKTYLDYSVDLMKANLMDPLMVIGTLHT